jgi:hypothetical protein
MASAWEEWKLKNQGKTLPINNTPREVKPWDFLNPNTEYASAELASERYEICTFCPKLINLTKQCKECGCFMAAKTKLQNAVCPLGKW